MSCKRREGPVPDEGHGAANKELSMPVRILMIAMFGLVIAAILSVLVVQQFDTESSPSKLTPPDPLVTTPEREAREAN